MEKNRTNPGRGYYHVCSDGNFASVLMDNHFHFIILAPDEDTAFRFANEFKRLTGLYLTIKYHRPNSLRKLPVKVLPIPDDEVLYVFSVIEQGR